MLLFPRASFWIASPQRSYWISLSSLSRKCVKVGDECTKSGCLRASGQFCLSSKSNPVIIACSPAELRPSSHCTEHSSNASLTQSRAWLGESPTIMRSVRRKGPCLLERVAAVAAIWWIIWKSYNSSLRDANSSLSENFACWTSKEMPSWLSLRRMTLGVLGSG